MKRIIALLALIAATIPAWAQNTTAGKRIVCDETCREEYQKAETAAAAPKPEATKSETTSRPVAPSAPGAATAPLYAVVSPVGRSNVEMINQAPRLETLDGKTIAVVGVSFMTGITHPEIKRLIKENYPRAKVILLDEIGISGPYPAPGVTRKQNEEFKRNLQEMGVDALISGNGGCGLCTPKEVGSCITAEYIGIPSVMIAGPGFSDQARYTSRNNGVPVMRVAEYPGAFAADSEETLVRNTREVLWPQIVKALTTPISPEELSAAGEKAGDLRDDVFYGTLEEVDDYFRKQNWTDGLPFVPPTYEKVTHYLEYTPYRYDETVAVLPIAHRNTTAWHVAVNAVMAGCKPEHMPILIALTKGLGDGTFRRTLASTHAWAPYCWLNGPVARQLGIDCGQGQINEAANVAIGRFLNLALMNLCGYYVKQDRMGTFGYPMPWCLVEDEQACARIGWKPWHVRKGFGADESVVTLGSTLLWGNNMAPSTTDPVKVMQLLAWDISERCQFALGSGRQYTFRTILMTEPVAGILARKFKSPEALEHILISESRRPLKERAFANYYANPGSRKDGGKHNLRQYTAHIEKTEGGEMTNVPEWYDSDAAEMKTVPTMKRGMTAFLITGDSARNKVQTMPGGGYASVKIELPGNWDALMKELGYQPLKNHYIR
ncbi:MAG: hypothetical protein MJY57_02865 [Bacteroidales bacterium]|nr:hypothetical protein [Bacteroidales bacterium]